MQYAGQIPDDLAFESVTCHKPRPHGTLIRRIYERTGPIMDRVFGGVLCLFGLLSRETSYIVRCAKPPPSLGHHISSQTWAASPIRCSKKRRSQS